MLNSFELMTPAEVEAWALMVCDRVARRQRIEDSRVEAKAEWIDAPKAARRLAGHANAAAGAPILWLLGLDEIEGVKHLDSADFAGWWDRVRSNFSELAPAVRDFVVPFAGETVLALLFKTDRAPFLTRNPSYGKPSGGPVEMEVPWREGTQVRSARRSDLIRILVPQRLAPLADARLFELRGCFDSVAGSQRFKFSLSAKIYLVPRGLAEGPLVLPNHKASVVLLTPGHDGPLCAFRPTLQATSGIRLGGSRGSPFESIPSATIAEGPTEIVAAGPGMIVVDGWGWVVASEGYEPPASLRVEVILDSAEGGSPVRVVVEFPPFRFHEPGLGIAPGRPFWYWRWEADEGY
jgi:hypothetical protein